MALGMNGIQAARAAVQQQEGPRQAATACPGMVGK